ncbi:MAG: sodium:solute symporter, partial [Flavobacteriales bacterium]|nr:sodium:solute symporter [Flavobacteriales bacterium]
SALTALTTSFCVDILDIAKRPEATREGLRRRVHVGMSVALAVIILIFREWNDASVISAVFT